MEGVPPEEQMAERVLLQLKEIQVTVTPVDVIICVRGACGNLSYKEWRVTKSFVDTIIAEFRPPRR
jgi:hypothetical protein